MPNPTGALLTQGTSTTDATSFVTPSITPAANKLITVMAYVTGATPVAVPAVSGCGLTWDSVANTTAGPRNLFLFRALGTPTAGALTFTGSATWTSIHWQVVEWTDADTSGTNGAGAIVQSIATKPADAASVNLPYTNAVVAGNTTYAAVTNTAGEAPVAGAGWSAVAAAQTQVTPSSGFLGEASTTTPQQNITASWTTVGIICVVGIEIKAAAGGSALTAAPADTATAAEATSTAIGFNQAAADTATTAEATATAVAAQRDAADTATSTDAATTAVGFDRAAADAGNGSDTVTPAQTFARDAADTGAGSDTATATLIVTATAADTGTSSDAATTALTYGALPADSGSGTETATTTLSAIRVVVDVGTGTDTATATLLSASRDITVTVGIGKSRTLTAVGRARAMGVTAASRTLTANPRE